MLGGWPCSDCWLLFFWVGHCLESRQRRHMIGIRLNVATEEIARPWTKRFVCPTVTISSSLHRGMAVRPEGADH